MFRAIVRKNNNTELVVLTLGWSVISRMLAPMPVTVYASVPTAENHHAGCAGYKIIAKDREQRFGKKERGQKKLAG